MAQHTSSLRFEVEENRLFVNRNGACTHRISLWPRPNAEICTRSGTWERFYPEFRVISYPLPKPKKKAPPQLEFDLDIGATVTVTQSKRLAYDQLRKTMPVSYSMALAPFKSHQWNMVVFLSFHRRFYELIKANPAIAFLLANRREFNWRIYRKEINLEELTGMKQTQLLEQLGLPGAKRIVQITKKIHPSSIHLRLLEALKICVQREDALKKLSHLQKINAGALALLTCSEPMRRHVSIQLLQEVSMNSQNNHYYLAAHQLDECLKLHQELRTAQAFPRFRTLAELESYYEELVDSATRLLAEQELAAEREQRRNRSISAEQLRSLRRPFGKPPIQACANIKPLRTPSELLQEGQLQRNCVGGYADRVRSRRCYIYRVTAPERATLSVIKTAGGEWAIGELFAACNEPVRRETEMAVNDWLTGEQLGI